MGANMTNYKTWRKSHMAKRTGEPHAQLQRRDDTGERHLVEHVLLPALGTLDFLHPEFAYTLSNGRTIYMDVAYVRPPLFIDFELDGYGPHLARISREQFATERRRDALLKLDDWHVIRIAHDDTLDPRATPIWIRTIRALLDKFGQLPTTPTFSPAELTLIRTTLRSPENKIKMKEAAKVMGCSANTAKKHMVSLVERNIFRPLHADLMRIHTYQLNLKHPEIRALMI
jgi:hypothetical protein